MKSRKIFFLCLYLSLILHGTFFLVSMAIRIPGVQHTVNRARNFFNLKSLDNDAFSIKPIHERDITYAQAIKFQKPAESRNIKPMFHGQAFETKNEAARENASFREEVSFVNLEDIKKPLKEYTTADITAQKNLRQTRKELVDIDKFKREDGIINPGEILETELNIREFADKMPGFTPSSKAGMLDALKDKVISGLSKSNMSVVPKGSRYTNIEEFLACDLSVYKDPQDEQKYFKITIKAGKDADKLPRVCKEIIFLIDCSLSTQAERLEQFKSGVKYCLNNLNVGDMFNIAAFKGEVHWFRPYSVEPDKKAISEALRFVGSLTADQNTDAYQALNDTITEKTTMVPTYIVFLSDGRPTHGVTSSRKIINEISRINNSKRPIFAFSGGSRVNRYFLDFISYKNRGWTEYAERTHFIAKGIAKFYDKIRDPLLLNLRYHVSGLNYSDMAPKMLPDFYRNAEFAIYGKFTGEEEFCIQLLGEIEDETNEFTVIASLSDAAQGDKFIAKNWAFNRIYYLISLLEYGGDNTLELEEINTLCDKFGIKTPYSDDIKT